MDHLNLNKYPKAKTLTQHGISFFKLSGEDNLQGKCIFCNADKFYANHQTKLWVCDNCHLQGNFGQFLEQVSILSQRHLKSKKLIALSNDRGIKKAILRASKVGFNPFSGYYTIPIYHHSGNSLIDLRLFKIGNKLISSLGGKAGMSGIENILDDNLNNPVWICEGEWDYLIAKQIIIENDLNIISVGIPGSGVFKKEWQTIFDEKDILVIYDNDDAGIEGENKIHRMISNRVKSIQFVHWKNKIKGYDLRDLYIENVYKTYDRLQELIKDKPRLIPGKTEAIETDFKPKYSGEGVGYHTLINSYKKWFEGIDTRIIDVVFGTIIANRLPGDPVWLFVVGVPGCGKSEVLGSLTDAIGIITSTNITPKGLISGAPYSIKGDDPSLIPKLNNKVLIIKDFTTILSMPYMDRDAIFGILRDAYDGRTEKYFGVPGVGFRTYKSKFGIISGVTTAIERMGESYSALGERFLKFKIIIPKGFENRFPIIIKAIENVGKEDNYKKEINNMVKDALNYDFEIDSNNLPYISFDDKRKIIKLSHLVATLRTVPDRDKYTKQINYKPEPEIATRIGKEMYKISLGIMLFKDKFEYEILKHITKSSIPGRIEEIIRKIFSVDYKKGWFISDISEITGLPSDTTSLVMQNLIMLKAMRREKILDKFKTKYQYFLDEEIIDLIQSTELYYEKEKKKKTRVKSEDKLPF